MAVVGIIANPAASKDIRRLVAQGRVIPDWEKVNTVRRVMLGLQSLGIEKVVAMPDSSNLCRRARDDSHLAIELSLLEMSALYTEGDTVRAAELMSKIGVDCLVTLGGDGTNRAAAKGCAETPLVAISTGTNNVFPAMVEGTLAGIAAGLVAQGKLPLDRVSNVSKTLEIHIDGEYQDLALVDVALSRERFVASRAIWDLDTLYEVFLTRAEPSSIGLSSVGGQLQPVSLADNQGLRYVLGESTQGNSMTVTAPIAPGMVSEVAIADWQLLNLRESILVDQRHYTVAVDGERAFNANPQQQLVLVLQRNGPTVVDVPKAMQVAAELGLLRR